MMPFVLKSAALAGEGEAEAEREGGTDVPAKARANTKNAAAAAKMIVILSSPLLLRGNSIIMLNTLRFLSFLLYICSLWLPQSYGIPQGPHINNLNVLLPPKTTHPVRFRLQGSGGCFTWMWDHHDLIHVQPEFGGTESCSENAVITSIASYTGRRATAVYARDTVTGQVIRCEVFIDKVSSIKISHHSLKLDLDGLATLRIHGFDVEDNMFSSLVGIQISWRFHYSESSMGVATHCLVHVPLKDTALSDEIDTRIELEEKGSGSDLLVVRGVSVGHERVSANVIEPTMEVLEDEISLTVAEAISIEPPSPLYVLVDTQFHYTLKTLRYKLPLAIQLPSVHHRWSVMDSAIAEVDQYMGKVSTQTVGNTEIVVEDVRLAGHKQFSSLHVVTPSSLQLYLAPLGFHNASQQTAMKKEAPLCSSDLPWYLIVGWDYVIQVMAFSDESSTTPLHITQGNDLKFSFEEWPYWKALPIPEDVQCEQGWRNGTFIKAVSEGSGKIAASLSYRLSLMSPNEVLTVDQEIIVCNPVLVLFENGKHANVLSLPWHPAVMQAYHLKVHGGCGTETSDYQWVSLDPKIVSVNAFGTVYAKGEGKTVVHAIALTNPMNSDKVKVHISYPSSIVRVEDFPLEIEVGSYLPAAVTMRNSDGQYYSKCESFSSFIKWKIIGEEKVFVQRDSVEMGESMFHELAMVTEKPICDLKYFLAVQAGRATITASLPSDEFTGFSASKHLVSWTISAYAPLTILQTADGHSYGGYDCGMSQAETSGNASVLNHCQINMLQLVPKTSMKVMLRGGPDRWGQGTEFIERHRVISGEGADAEQIHVSHLTSGGGRLYDIHCVGLGNYTIIFYRGNLAGVGHPVPTVASVNLTVVCADPSAIALIVDDIEHSLPHIKAAVQENRDDNFVHKTPITVMSGRGLRVAAVALDAFGAPFANASSLPINWMLSDCLGLAYWEGHQTSEVSIENARWEENLVLTDNSGQCLVRASVGLLNLELPTPVRILETRLYFLTDAVQLQIVTSLRVSPKFLLLYNHPDAKGSFSVLGGSSHIEADINDTKVAFVLEQPHAPDYLHMTIAARGLGTALITVYDVGLISPAFDSAMVSVADLAWVHLLLPEEASIEVGSILTVKLQAGDNSGNIFNDSQLELMEFNVHIKDEILELLFKNNVDQVGGEKVYGSEFTIRGANVGVTDLYVSASQSYGHDIVSELLKVEVYQPLSIQPKGLVLTPGSHYVVNVHGGPSFGTSIKFLSSNDTIASVDKTLGMVTANFPGTLFVYAEATTHSGIVICKATLEVSIHVPTAMTLNVRGGQIAVGRKLSVFPMGIKEDIFSFYELCGNYRWRVEDPEVLSLRTTDNLKERENIEIVSTTRIRHVENYVDAKFSAVVFGKSAGKTNVNLEFSCHFHSNLGYSSTHFYTAAGTLQVIPDPPLALGMCATWLLPPSYRTSSLLRQSTEAGLESMSITKRNIVYSMLQDSNRDPMSISLDGAHIRTSERKGLACIQARDQRTGRTEIAVCIRVAEVSQIIIGDIETSIRRMEMSVGAHQYCSVTLQDEVGFPFFEVGDAIHLVAETNRIDVVSIKVLVEDDDEHARNATILIQALRQGTAMVRISLMGNPAVADYILVHVGTFIIPRNPTLHIGGYVNFSVAAKRHVTDNGHWLSSNADVIQINEHSGEAYAVGPGSAVVSYDSSYLTAYTTASVVQITSIFLKAPSELLTNAQVPENGYLFPVKFSDLHGQDVGAFATDQRILYSCHVDPPYIGRTLAFHDPADGKSYCVLQPYSPERLFLTLQGLAEEAGTGVVVGDAKGCLTIKITAAVQGMPDIGSIMTPFAGGFQIREKRAKILLTPAANKTKVTVVGSAGAVLVSWSRNDLLNVTRISSDRDAYGFGGYAIFEVSIINGDSPFVSNLVFRLPTTGQIEEILVEYDLKDLQYGGLMRQIVTAVIAAVVLGMLPFVVCARVFDIPRRHNRQQHDSDSIDGQYMQYESPRSPSGTLAPSGFPSPQTVTLSRSPPQPYTDYVSKTIDHTPYFRREGLRRFDPSRTY